MAAAQLPPLEFGETGFNGIFLSSFQDEVAATHEPSFHDQVAATLEENPYVEYLQRKDNNTQKKGTKPQTQMLAPTNQSRLDSPTLSPLVASFGDRTLKAQRSPSCSSSQESHFQDRFQHSYSSDTEDLAESLHFSPPQDSQPLDLMDQHYHDQHPPPVSQSSVPEHPIVDFQNAFAESLQEVTEETGVSKPVLHNLDSQQRRERLLNQDMDDEPFDASWRYRPGQTQHEVMKLVAQISFGVYLMFNGMANSNSQVIAILQGHIDEIDEFLEITIEDLNQAVLDLTKRIEHLKLPMENLSVFEHLLEDRQFRSEILSGNERIEFIIARTNVAMRQWDDDIEAGLKSSSVFSNWLSDQSAGEWRREQPDLNDVFDAMKGNTEGWITAFEDMNDRAQEVNALVMTLMAIITEIESKAGEVSRRTWTSVQPFSSPSGASTYQSTLKSVHGASPSPPPSSHSQTKSPVPSTTQVIASNALSLTPNESSNGDGDDDDDTFFPLPGGLPLLPPLSARTRDNSSPFARARDHASLFSKPLSRPASELPIIPVPDTASIPTPEDTSLYVLQPRTYTPQPTTLSSPALGPSTTLRREPSSLHKRPLLRDRMTNPPTSMQILPMSKSDSPVMVPSANVARNISSMDDLRGVQTMRNHAPSIARVASPSGTFSSGVQSSMSSPFSDRHAFQPVRASPHSPLQQRPHTSAGSQHSGSVRSAHKPNTLVADMNNAAAAQDQNSPKHMSNDISPHQLKKKKSAFGWFKQAFTMDDDERAAFKTRRTSATSQQSSYYDSSLSPRFLDGRRLR